MSEQQRQPHRRPVNRRRQRRKRAVGGIVLLLTLAVLLGVVFVLGKLLGSGEEPASSTPPASAPAPASSLAVASAPPQSTAPQSPPATGPLDVEGPPPLYNRDNPIPEEAHGDNITLGDAGGGYQMEPLAAQAFREMVAAAKEDGVTLTPISGYRSNERQTNNYNAALARNLEASGSEEEARRLTDLYYAKPGTSEHEAGLAMDIGSIDESFADTAAYGWLREHCTEYGFIYRYPNGNRSDGKSYTDDLTHIAWEPWHYRFVGANHAAEIERLSATLPGADDVLTLEEYIDWLAGKPVPVLEGASASAPPQSSPASASGQLG